MSKLLRGKSFEERSTKDDYETGKKKDQESSRELALVEKL